MGELMVDGDWRGAVDTFFSYAAGGRGALVLGRHILARTGKRGAGCYLERWSPTRLRDLFLLCVAIEGVLSVCLREKWV